VVFEQRIDTLPNGAELCAMPPGELLRRTVVEVFGPRDARGAAGARRAADQEERGVMRDMHAFAAALSGSGWAMPSAGVVVAPAPDKTAPAATACGLTAPGQPCAKWPTPPRGECSRLNGERICGECIRDMDAPALGFRRRRSM
jgi:hypothetical protein